MKPHCFRQLGGVEAQLNNAFATPCRVSSCMIAPVTLVNRAASSI